MLREINSCHCYCFKLPERSLEHANLTMSHLLSTIRGLLRAYRSFLSSQCTMLLLTSMPLPTPPYLLRLPFCFSTWLTHPSRLCSGDISRKPFLHLPGWVRCSLCVFIMELTTCTVSYTHVCVLPTGLFSTRARTRSFCSSL